MDGTWIPARKRGTAVCPTIVFLANWQERGMRMKTLSWVVVAIVMIVACVVVYLSGIRQPHLSDVQQLKQVLAEAEAAVESKDLNRAMSLVSPAYRDSYGTTKSILRLEAIRAFRSAAAFDVSLQDARIECKDDEAQVETDVLVDAIENGKRSRVVDAHLKLDFKKEPVRRWVFLKVARWRLISVSGISTAFEEY